MRSPQSRLAVIALGSVLAAGVVLRADPPLIAPIPDQEMFEDATPLSVPLTVTPDENEADPIVSVTVESVAPSSILTATMSPGAPWSVTLTPVPDAWGVVTVTIRAVDASNESATQSFTVTVAPVADTPSVTDAVTLEDTQTSSGLVITRNAVDGSEVTHFKITSIANGSLFQNDGVTPIADGTFITADQGALGLRFTPAPDSTATGSFSVQASTSASDAGLGGGLAVASIVVTAVNDAPTISVIADQVTAEDTAVGPVAFTVGDVETPAAALGVTAATSNATLLPVGNIVLGGTGASRTVTLTPAPDQAGTATVTLTVSDGELTATTSFVLTVTAVNDAPTISVIADQVTAEDTAVGPVAFTVGDVETPAAALGVTAATSNATLLPVGNIVLGGTGASRTVTLTPAPDQAGTATVTLTVSDGELTATTSFVLTVTAVNDAPTISVIADQVTAEDTAVGPVAFTVGDVETPAAALGVTAATSNATLLPVGNIVLGGTGASRTVTLTPAPDQAGTATVTLTVSDGELTATTSFVLTVTAVNDAPTISAIADQVTAEDTAVGPVAFTVGDVETPAAALGVTAATSNATLLPVGNIVLGGTGASRTVTLTPAPDQAGTATVTLTVSDGELTATTSFVLTVAAVNDAPTISAIADQVTAEDTAVAVPVVVGDVDTPLDQVVVTATSSNPGVVANAGLVVTGTGGTRTLTVTPVPDAFGTADITVVAFDGQVASVARTFRVTVTAVNDAPTISAIADQVTAEDTAVGPVAFTVGDVETPAAALGVTAATSNATLLPVGNIVLGGTGASRTVTLTPAPDQAGSATVTLTVSDGELTATTSFVLTVTPVNDPPTIFAIPDQVTAEDTPITGVGVTVSDPDTPVANLTLTATSSNPDLVPASGVTFAGSGGTRTLSITPAANRTGSATITVTVSDGALSASRAFVLTVTPVNDAPTISAIADQTTAEDTPVGPVVFVVGDVETEAAALGVTAATSNATLLPVANIVLGGTGATRTVTLTPAPDQAGTATVTLTVSDGELTATTSFVLTVTPVNDPPTISALADQTTAEDTAVAVAVVVGDVDTPLDQVVVTATSSNPAVVANAGLVVTGTGGTRTVTVTPVPDAFGTADITVVAFDGQLASVARTFRVTVTAVNDRPTISAIANQTTAEDTPVGPVVFVVGDVETEAAALGVTAATSNATLLPVANIVLGGTGATRTVTLTPAPDQAGTATVTLTVSDGELTATTSFVLTVTPVNDAPTISDLGDLTTTQDVPAGPIAFIVGDVETPAASLLVAATSSDQTLVPSANLSLGGTGANRTLTITPAPGRQGTTIITVSVTDADATTTTDSFVFRVNPPNAPTISDIPNQTIAEDTSTGALAFTIGDPDGVDLIVSVTASSSNPALVPNTSANLVLAGAGANRTITVVPAANQFGTTTVTVTVRDHTGLEAVDSFVVTVTPVNDPPTIAAIPDQATDEDVGKVVPLTVSDPDPADALTVTATSSNQAVVADSGLSVTGAGTSRALTITPLANAFGSTQITVRVSDGTAPPVTTTFTLTVNPVNDAPTITPIGDRATDEDVALGPLAFTIGDVETPAALLTLTRASSNTTLLPVNRIVFGGSGANRTVTLTPAANRFGEVTVTIGVSDGTLTTTTSFTLTVRPVNDPPTLAAIADVTTDEDTPAAVTLTVGDVDHAPSVLRVSATSSNPALLPVSGIAFTGTTATRTMTLTPAPDVHGVATIVVRVEDDEVPEPGWAERSFTLTVRPVNDPPSISAIADQATPEDTQVGPIAFSVADIDNEVASLSIAVASSNQDVVRNTGIQLGGTGALRSLTIQPELGVSGTAIITVTVSDGQDTASTSFSLDVSSVPCAYTVTAVPTALAAAGDSVTVTVQSNRPSCAWSLSSDAPWAVPVTPSQGFGNGSVRISIAPNPSSQPRSAVVTVAGQAITLTQAGAAVCSVSLSPSSQSLGASGGVATVAVTVSGTGCGSWSASAGAAWLVITAGATGTGNGTIALNAASNTTSAARSATVTVTLSGGAVSAIITQAAPSACTYMASPGRLAYGPSGGLRVLEVQTSGGAGGCAWSVSVANAASWVTLSVPQGFGTGSLAVSVDENRQAAQRETTLLLRDGANAVVATVVVAQDGIVSGDADGDGLPSSWEQQFGLDPTLGDREDGPLGDPDGDGVDNLNELRNGTHPRGFRANTRYLAEGATSAFFSTRLALLNPGAETARVLLRFQRDDGEVRSQFLAVPPMTRQTLDVATVTGMDQAEFSTVLESDQLVVLDRTMSWDRSGYGSHAETGLPSPRTRWYFAEGATFGGFDLFYLLQNPGTVAADVEVRFLLARGAPVTRRYTVPASSRFNIWVDQIPELAEAEVSAVIDSVNGVPILAERAMYLSTGQQLFQAGHESAAVAEPRTRWFLAEGATGEFFDLFVLVANPNDVDAEIEGRYLLRDGTVIPKRYTVPPNSRFNIWVDLEDPQLAQAEVSTVLTVTNGVPVIVERAMWWPGPTDATWTEAHNSAGSTETGTVWALAEGEQSATVDTFILIANTSPAPATVEVTLVFEDGPPATREVTLPRSSRTNVWVAADFPEAAGRRFGALIRSLGETPAELVVERAMYMTSGATTWAAGTNALATRLR